MLTQKLHFSLHSTGRPTQRILYDTEEPEPSTPTYGITLGGRLSTSTLPHHREPIGATAGLGKKRDGQTRPDSSVILLMHMCHWVFDSCFRTRPETSGGGSIGPIKQELVHEARLSAVAASASRSTRKFRHCSCSLATQAGGDPQPTHVHLSIYLPSLLGCSPMGLLCSCDSGLQTYRLTYCLPTLKTGKEKEKCRP